MGAAAAPIAGAVIGGVLSSRGTRSGTQTIDQAPWGPAQPSLGLGLAEINRIYGNSPMAPVQEYGLVDPAAAELLATIRGDRLNQNPYIDDVIRRASADVNSQFEGMSRYGSGAHLDSLFTSAAAPIRYADYARERANQLAAIQAAPGFEMVPYQLQAARSAAPYEAIRNYLDLLNPIARGGGTQTSPIYSNPLAGALGGGLLGYTISQGGKGATTSGGGGTFFP